MRCPWRASHLQLLTVTVFLVTQCITMGMQSNSTSSTTFAQHVNEKTSKGNANADSAVNSSVSGKQCTLKSAEARTVETVSVGAKLVLSCCPILSPTLVLATWKVDLGGRLNCTIAYKGEENKTSNNCSDNRITWASRPDQNPALQIERVAVSHEGKYQCEIVTPDGNVHIVHQLQVLVPPEVTTWAEHRTAVCQAAAGKPAARISWAPEGACDTAEETHLGNGTATIKSTCRLAEDHLSTVNCSIFHLTGNMTRSISIQLQLSETENSMQTILSCSISLILIVLTIMGSILFLKNYHCRKCKFKEREDSLVMEDEMQPYASYTEKNNPLYDTTNRTKMSQV
ncbi:cell surface glycoprotein CD200 receptor 1 [Sorex araneus]|uniref:cell surface glycoprotein CD200 receptor 1 n=1 Tax=Sorex araneus TaxID=42254 RepID=UPI00243374A1|nr:cell surface glycoprotein CD200 receptor 1 [Sorex araneus]